MQNIFKNKHKPSRYWDMKLILSPGVITDQNQWTEIGVDNIELCVSYNDQQIVSETQLMQTRTVELCFEDSKIDKKNNLVVSIKGITSQQHMIKIMVYVQDHCVNGIFLDQLCYHTDSGEIKHGSTYMGEDGHQIFEINNPIYTWLFEHEYAVIKEISE